MTPYFVICQNHIVQEGTFVRETLALHARTFATACSDLWAIHPRKCNHGKKEVSLIARAVMKSLLVGTGHYLCKLYSYHDSRACGYKQSKILF
jgi:hypothetical protein